jgi:hypothetical protein
MRPKHPVQEESAQRTQGDEPTPPPFRELSTVCSDCKTTMLIRVPELARDYEELMSTVLCQACLDRRVQQIAVARRGRIERRGRPRKRRSS